MKYIGIDLGTSAVKIIMMDENGIIQKSVRKEYPIAFPRPGWSEQDPEKWYAQTLAGLKELLAGKGRENRDIGGISFGGQMHGLVILDEQDKVIRPALLWNDGRSGECAERLNQTVGREKLSEYTGNIAFAGFTASKLLWVYENEPENFKRIKKIMLPKDYLAYRLSGAFCTDVSDASGTLLFDVQRKRWSGQMLEICHIKEEQLPAIYESYECVGMLKEELSRELEIEGEVRIIAGAGDNAAAAVGNGVVGEGQCNLSLGTSGTLFISGKEFRADPHYALHSFAHADGNYHMLGCMLSAASCNKWWVEDILKEKDLGAEQEKIHRLGENHVYFLPYLMGERSPHNDPDARGVFAGMTMDTRRSDLQQAVLEGVIFALRDSLEIARSLGYTITKMRVCGGGAQSPLWLKMIADIMNVEVEVPEQEEGPAFGAAILAAVGCGAYGDVKEAALKLVKVKETLKPEKELVLKYEKKYRIFQTLYPALKPVFKKMAKEEI